MANAPPSANPADEDTLAGALKTVLRKFLMSTDDMLPATVIAYDRVKNIATVKPQVMAISTNMEVFARPQYANIPVFALGGGYLGGTGFVINFPLQPGDSGWIKANDRDIGLYVQALAEAKPNTNRLHTFKDAMFFPDAMRKFVVDSEDEDAMVIQVSDSKTKLAIHRDGHIVVKANDLGTITMANTGKITADANGASVLVLDEGGNSTLDATTFTVNANTVINGNFNANGSVFEHNNVNVGFDHDHSDVEPGSGTSGPPVPQGFKMAISISTNDRNDIFVLPNKNLSTSVNLQAILEDCKHAMSAQLGEMIYAINKGIPTLDTVWLKLNKAQFIASGRNTLLGVPGVKKVRSFTVSVLENTLKYEAVIQTIYGVDSING